MSVVIVVGAQYGSEAKGTLVGHLAIERNLDITVRTGAVNAGHTIYYKGLPYKMQQIPTAWVNPETNLVIGAGAYIHAPTLLREIDMINAAMPEADVRDRLFIDIRCAVHTNEHHDSEQSSGLHERMGSTGEGVAAAIVDKMNRRFEYKLFGQTPEASGLQIIDTIRMLNLAHQEGQSILLEGTQGALLDFHLGHYPFVTTRMTTAAAWLAEAGLPVGQHEVILVARTFPIRVAGNSGPLPNEISWVELIREIEKKRGITGMERLISEDSLTKFETAERDLAKEMGLPSANLHLFTPEQRRTFSHELSIFHQKLLTILPDPVAQELKKFLEMTTVTKKLRRIARLDMDDLDFACRVNGATSIALMFTNYLFPALETCSTAEGLVAHRDWPTLARGILTDITVKTGVFVSYINTNKLSVIKLP